MKPTNEQRWAGLMRAARSGDGAAYRALLGELSGVVRQQAGRALARAGRGNAEVEDIVQEVLLAIHLKRETWDADLPFSPWLFAVVRYKIIDTLRRVGVRSTVPIEDFEAVLPAPEPAGEGRQEISRLVARLEERPRAIVEAISVQGHSAGEVASRLNMSEGAVRVALHRALKVLARLYREERP